MKIEENKIILENQKDFTPKHVFECGQCFRWEENKDGSYTIVVYEKILNVKRNLDDIIIEVIGKKNLSKEDMTDLGKKLEYYFDLETDYSKIKNVLSKLDGSLKKASEFGEGIRILNQPYEECLISFIISARNSIPLIKNAIKNLSKKYGKEIGEYNGKKYYAFPEMTVLANASEKDIQDCKTGFRAKYIKAAAQKILDEKLSFTDYKKLNIDETREKLMEFAGIGPKVSECVALFSLKKFDAFPVDVWVNRVMEELYFKGEKLSLEKLRIKSKEKFGALSGYAQQYLFYYAREKGIGTKKQKI